MPHVLNPLLCHHGAEQQSLLLVDGFAAAPDELVAHAAMRAFQPIGPHYPGVRAIMPPALVRKLVAPVMEAMISTFAIDGPLETLEAYFSVVTTPPEALSPIQRLPHFDSVDPGRIALLLYLAPGMAGGTAFFRHRTSSFESVTADRLAAYAAALEADVARHGVPPPAYISGDTALFAQVGHYAGSYNRAIIYRGNTLHCADIPAGTPLSAEPGAGRLTVNIFLAGKVRHA